MFKLDFLVLDESIINGITEKLGYTALFEDNKEKDKWLTRSGRWGKGALPYGLYEIEQVYKLEPHIPGNLSYMRDGFPWFASLKPEFETVRFGFGLHPDGGVPGTLGCPAILERDIQLFGVLHSIKQQQPKLLYEVKKWTY